MAPRYADGDMRMEKMNLEKPAAGLYKACTTIITVLYALIFIAVNFEIDCTTRKPSLGPDLHSN